MANRIMTTHVGSLIRPPKFVEVLHTIENKEPVEPGLYDKTLTDSVAEVVRQQAEVGVDIVSDGEFGKGRNWAFYVHSRLSDIVTRPLTPEEAKDPHGHGGRRTRPRGVSGILRGGRQGDRARLAPRQPLRHATVRSTMSARRNCSATSTTSRRRSPR